MIRNCLSIIFILILGLFSSTIAFAATLYSNEFTSDLSGYQEFFNHCFTSSLGLRCSGPTNEQYLSVFPKIACISADFTDPASKSDGLYLTDSTIFVDNYVVLRPNYDSQGHIEIDTAHTPLGTSVSSTSTPSGKHNYMLCKDNNIFRGYLDNIEVVSYTEIGHNPVSFAIGSTGGNVILTNLILSDSLPVSSQPQLPVPLIKQTNPLWSAMEYDSAQKWAPTDPTIGDWGCALTSATMVLQYYGLTKMPDGTPLNPASVNKWLKSQKNGYEGDGLLNWLAISKLAKLAKSQNPSFAYDALEYRRQENFSSSVLDTDLHNNQPDILGEPGHFIVGIGEDNNIFSINDPFYDKTSLSSYNNTALSMGRYIPSNTNLSYIQIVLPTTVDAILQNANGQKEGSDGVNNFSEITDGDYYMEGLSEPITGEQNAASKFLIIPTPQDGKYSITFYSSTTQPLNTKIFTYDVDGNVSIDTLTGNITAIQPKTIIFSYQQQPNTSKADRICQIFQQHISSQQVSDFLCNLITLKMQ